MAIEPPRATDNHLAGTPEEAADRIRAWDGVAERVILGVPWYSLSAARQRQALEGALTLGARLVRD